MMLIGTYAIILILYSVSPSSLRRFVSVIPLFFPDAIPFANEFILVLDFLGDKKGTGTARLAFKIITAPMAVILS
jgi:hypothetical protein